MKKDKTQKLYDEIDKSYKATIYILIGTILAMFLAFLLLIIIGIPF